MAVNSRNPVVQKALNYSRDSVGQKAINATVARNAITEWERTYTIKGLPVRLAYRGSPYNDVKATVDGGNRDWVEIARVVMSNPPSQAGAEKLCAAKWANIKRTAKNADGVLAARNNVARNAMTVEQQRDFQR